MLFNFLKYLLKPFLFFFYKIKLVGRENLPADGKYILCANHLNNWDPVLIGVAFPYRIYPMAKAELFKNRYLAWLLRNVGCFPIKRGEADITAMKTAMKIITSGKILGLFPEGKRNNTDEVIAEPGAAMLAIKTKTDVLPVAIVSNYKLFGETKVIIGKPIKFNEYYGKKLYNNDYSEISLIIMKNIKALTKGEIYENNIG